VDVWHERTLFDMSHVAGCPPDDVSPLGQKWGFPTFNWSSMKARKYLWWKRRLNVITSCYHIYRFKNFSILSRTNLF